MASENFANSFLSKNKNKATVQKLSQILQFDTYH